MVKPPGPLLKAHLQSLWPRNLPGFTPQKKRISCKPILNNMKKHNSWPLFSTIQENMQSRGRLGSKMFQKHSWFETKSESAAAAYHLFSAPHLHGLQCLSLKKDSRHLFHQNMLCKYIIVYSIFWIVLDLRDIFLSRPGPAIFAIFASGCRVFHGVDCTNPSDGLRFRRNCLQRFVLVSSLHMFGLAAVLLCRLCRVLRTQCISCEHACLMHETDW